MRSMLTKMALIGVGLGITLGVAARPGHAMSNMAGRVTAVVIL